MCLLHLVLHSAAAGKIRCANVFLRRPKRYAPQRSDDACIDVDGCK
jgi:hypothetical protein